MKSVLLISFAIAVAGCFTACNDKTVFQDSVTDINVSATKNPVEERLEIAEQSMNFEPETQEQTLERLKPIESIMQQDETETVEQTEQSEMDLNSENIEEILSEDKFVEESAEETTVETDTEVETRPIVKNEEKGEAEIKPVG